MHRQDAKGDSAGGASWQAGAPTELAPPSRWPAEDSDERARELLLVASHDLCAPLSAIRMQVGHALSRLRRGEDLTHERLVDVFKRVDRLAGDGLRLIDDVLAVARLHRRAPGSDAEVDIEAVLAAIISLHAEALRRAACDLYVERDGMIDNIRGRWDRRALESLFSNLIQNVTRHAAGAPVRVQFSGVGQDLRIRFSDGAPGLGAAAAAEPKDQSSPANDLVDQSHGLGIWIIHRAVAELGGKLEMRNGPQGGLRYEIWLPRCQPGADPHLPGRQGVRLRRRRRAR